MDPSLIILLVMVVVAEIVALYWRPDLPLEALKGSARLLRGVWLDLLLGFVFAGLADVLIPQPVLSRWLGSERPGQGILVGWAVGLLIPGGPYLVFPILAGLFKKGAAPGPLITLITAKTLVSPRMALRGFQRHGSLNPYSVILRVPRGESRSFESKTRDSPRETRVERQVIGRVGSDR